MFLISFSLPYLALFIFSPEWGGILANNRSFFFFLRSLDFDFMQLQLEAKQLGECRRERREADHFGDVVQVGVGAEARNLERTLQLLE